MKTVTKQEAIKGFGALGDLAHAGQTVMVLDEGKPWVKLVPASRRNKAKSVNVFRARLNRISKKPIPGAAEVLTQLRG